jgi:hypothetical protein
MGTALPDQSLRNVLELVGYESACIKQMKYVVYEKNSANISVADFIEAVSSLEEK